MKLFDTVEKRPDGRQIRYAVVGAGWIAQEDFMPGVEHTGNSVMTALVTGDAVKARELSEKYGIKQVTDYAGYDSVLRSGNIDAIYLSLPNSMHCDFAVRALEAGIHVLCEKPMAVTEEECSSMIAAGERSGAKLMIAYRLHFEPGTMAALETVRSGKIGTPRFFSSIFAQQVAPDNSRTDGGLWAGPLPDMGPYPINAVRQLFQAEPIEVFAFSETCSEARFSEVEEMISVLLRFPENRTAQFTVSYGANSIAEYAVVGTKGSLQMKRAFSWTEPLELTVTIGEDSSRERFELSDQFGGETKYFSDCILDDRQPEPDGEEGLADVRVIKAIEESLRTRQAQPVHAPRARKNRPTPEQVMTLPRVEPGELVHAAPADPS
jgi:predicted dehydrogenase